MDPLDAPTGSYLEAVKALYDRVTPLYVAHCSVTLQAGLYAGPREASQSPPQASNLWLARRAGIVDGERLLDLGCGVCGPAIDLATAYPSIRIQAMTVSPVQARMARQRVEEAGLTDRIEVCEGDYHHLPQADGSIDRVLFLESSGYSHDPARLFAEVRRVLRPGGQLYIKDLFARSGPYSEQELSELAGVRRIWGMRQVPTLLEWQACLRGVGLVEVTERELPEATSTFYWGSMFTDEFRLNAFGEEFFREIPTAGLVFYGEVTARRSN